MFKDGYHLTYCSNIHPGESWEETFENIKKYIPAVKQDVSGDKPFGIGLRLSNEASLALIKSEHLNAFKSWLSSHNCYVFTLNGFPYGGFHHQVVKDKVHQPDWTSEERSAYTKRLFDILEALLPADMDGGISTSPLSYRPWHTTPEQLDKCIKTSTLRIAEIAAKLFQVKQTSGKFLHLDIEPEPDGILENTQDVVTYFRDWLIPVGGKYLQDQLGISLQQAEACLKDHVQICYDVCHFAVVYEKPEGVFQAFKAEGIQVGKIQISAALKVVFSQIKDVNTALQPFVESTYLHQVVAKDKEGSFKSFPDLPDALRDIDSNHQEWRIHFHVPVFMADYGEVASTQQDIIDVMQYIAKEQKGNHLEVETYTWDVLPIELNLDLKDAIVRELKWVDEIRSAL